MDGRRIDGIYRALVSGNGDMPPEERLKVVCHLCVDLLPVAGAGIMLMAYRTHQGTIYATDDRIQQLEELQNAAAEGPCIDAYTLGRPVLEPDLADSGVRKWPVLAPGAIEAGIRALFSFPLQLDDASFGAFNLYRDEPGPLTSPEVADVRLLAAVAAREVLVMQAQAAPGSLPSAVADLSGDRSAIEQATGMVSAQTGDTILQAAHRLRAYARDNDHPLAVVARQVVTRSLRFPPAAHDPSASADR